MRLLGVFTDRLAVGGIVVMLSTSCAHPGGTLKTVAGDPHVSPAAIVERLKDGDDLFVVDDEIWGSSGMKQVAELGTAALPALFAIMQCDDISFDLFMRSALACKGIIVARGQRKKLRLEFKYTYGVGGDPQHPRIVTDPERDFVVRQVAICELHKECEKRFPGLVPSPVLRSGRWCEVVDDGVMAVVREWMGLDRE